MLTGKRFRLIRDTLAIADVDGKRNAVRVPGGEIIKVVADTEAGDGLVDVLWNGKIIEMFGVDVNIRGSEISERTAKA